LLGEQYIGIEAGASDQNLAAGDNVTATQSAVVLENLISQFLYNSAANNASSGAEWQISGACGPIGTWRTPMAARCAAAAK
jgi:phospholipid/cholesterol/gamma-HCH transport system substrate-binding protein